MDCNHKYGEGKELESCDNLFFCWHHKKNYGPECASCYDEMWKDEAYECEECHELLCENCSRKEEYVWGAMTLHMKEELINEMYAEAYMDEYPDMW